jgi:hypothetical protein
MKRASYRDAIDWVAQNDSPADEGNLHPETVSELVSSVLVADIFGVEVIKVGRDVVRRRLLLQMKRVEKKG